MKQVEYLSSSPRLTKMLGRLFAQSLHSSAVLCLLGDLGGGKTTFVQGLAGGFGIQERVRSPSFVLLKKYQIPKSSFPLRNFYHIDCYRIKEAEEIFTIGYAEILQDPNGFVVIEWADRIEKYLPPKVIRISFKFLGRGQRKILFKIV